MTQREKATRRDTQRHVVEGGGEVQRETGQVTRGPRPAVRSLNFIPISVGSH